MTVDYRETGLVSKIKQATGDSVKYGADMIGDEETKKVTVQAIGPSGGKVVGLNPLLSEESDRKDVTFSSAFAPSTPIRILCADSLPLNVDRCYVVLGVRILVHYCVDAGPSCARG